MKSPTVDQLVDLGCTVKLKPGPTTYINIHRVRLTHLVPGQLKYTYYGNGKHSQQILANSFEAFALPLTQPMAAVYVNLSTEKDKYIARGCANPKALEVGHKSNEEWVSLLCPQYQGFPIYETEEKANTPAEAIEEYQERLKPNWRPR